jgi:hypothetical protein
MFFVAEAREGGQGPMAGSEGAIGTLAVSLTEAQVVDGHGAAGARGEDLMGTIERADVSNAGAVVQ